MNVQELITDLAVAERRIKDVIKFRDINYGHEVDDAFEKHHIRTYYDLLQVDLEKALDLRDLAIKEKLINRKRRNRNSFN